MLLTNLIEQGPVRIHVDRQPMPDADDPDTVGVAVSEQSVHGLRTGAELTTGTLPMQYQNKLKAGEKYQLYWPSGEFNVWHRGVAREHIGKSLKGRHGRESLLPSLISPASDAVTSP